MKRRKGKRIILSIECIKCRLLNYKGTSRYITTKNRRNTSNLLTIYKYCKWCNQHTIFKEIH